MNRNLRNALVLLLVADIALGALAATVWTRGADAFALGVALTLPAAMTVALVAIVVAMGGGSGVLRLAWAYNARNWNVVWSYKFRLVSIFASLVVALLLAVLVGTSVVRYFVAPFEVLREAHPDIFRVNYLLYLGVGVIGFPLVWMAFSVPAERIRQEQLRGTFEILVPTRQGVATVPLGYLLYRMMNGVVLAALLLLVFAAVAPQGSLRILDPYAVAFAALALALSSLALWGLGLVFGGLVALYKEIGPVTAVVQFVMVALSGAYVPVEILPTWIRPVSEALPVTWIFRVLRGALLAEETVFDLLPELFILFGFGVVSVALGMWTYLRCIDTARRYGALYGY